MITVNQLAMRFGPKILFKNTSLQFNPGNHYGLIGANGSGKSTFLQILAGDLAPEAGEIAFPSKVVLGTLKQDQYLYEGEVILNVVLKGRKKLWDAWKMQKRLLESETFNEAEYENLTELERVIEQEGGYTSESEAAKLLEGLGIRRQYHPEPLSVLSGGYKLRVLLAQVLFGHPDILLLDEPTNHLDLFSIKWLEGYLRNFPGTLLVISHDRDFLNGVCDHIVDFDYSKIKVYRGNYETFLDLKKQDLELKQATLSKQNKKRQDMQEFVDRFRANATKARQAQSRVRMVEKLEEEMESIDLTPTSRLSPKIHFEPLRTTGIIALKVQGVSKSFSHKTVLDSVSFEIERGERLAIIGPNGIGKSTLLEILTGNIPPDKGSFEWGFAARPAYFPQTFKREVSGSLSLLDRLGQFDRDLPQEKLREILASVLFTGESVNQSIKTLSGGETARLILAKMMLQKPNILILDEPTNHLDMEAIEELIKALQSFNGTVLLVSHNRYFVSHIADRILEINFQGIKDFKGSFQDYIQMQEIDYLSSERALSQRHAEEERNKNNGPVKAEESSYEQQKKWRSMKAQLKKQMELAEEDCHKIEEKIKIIDLKLTSDGFYQTSSLAEQQLILKEKEKLEAELLESMEKWELTTQAYQAAKAS